jgi:hypothetical protein
MVKWLFGTVTGLAICVALVVGLAFGGTWLGLAVYKQFATEWESARTDVYRENKSYVEGTVRDLREMQREYVAASKEHRDALRSLILHRADELDRDRLPSDVRRFLTDLEEG